LKKFGVGFEILSTIIQGGKFYKKDPRYSLQLLNFIIPGEPIGTSKPPIKKKRTLSSTNDLFVDSSEDEDLQASSFPVNERDGFTEDETSIISHLADG